MPNNQYTLLTEKKNNLWIFYTSGHAGFVCLCWGLTSQSTIFQSCRDGATASWVINQYFRGVKCLAQGQNTAEVGFEPQTSRSGVRHSTTEPPRSLGMQVRTITCQSEHNKTKWLVHPGKSHISMGTRQVWSVFAVLSKDRQGPKSSSCRQQRLIKQGRCISHFVVLWLSCTF